MDEQSQQPRQTPRRVGRRVSYAVTIIITGLVVVALYLMNVYMPLVEGSFAGPDATVPGSLYVGERVDPFSGHGLWTYCSTPNGRFAWAISLRNAGPLPVIVLGGDPGPNKVTAATNVNGFSLVDLANLRQLEPADTPIWQHDIADPTTAPTLQPTSFGPDEELEVWARFQMGAQPLTSDGTMWTQSIWVRYSVFGVERTAEVPLQDGVGVIKPCTAALLKE